MSIVVRSPSWRAARSWLSAAGVVALLAAALAGPAVVRAQDGHHDGPTRLVDLSVRVQTADPGSATVFAATWIGHAGSGPDAIRVTVDSTAFNLAPASGRSAGAGRRYARSVVLDPGRHRVRFTATGRGHFRTVVDWGIVVVPRTARTGATTGSGASNPVSGGGGSGPGGSSGGSGSGPGGSSGGSGSGRGATGGMAGGTDPGTGPSASGSVGSGSSHDDPPVAGGGTAPDGGTAAVDGVATGAADGTPGPATAGRSEDSLGPGRSVTGDRPAGWAGPEDAAVLGVVGTGGARSGADPTSSGAGAGVGGSGAAGTTGGSGGRTAEAAPSGLHLLGLDGDLVARTFTAVPVATTTTGVVAVWAAFMMFGKKRRDEEQPAPDAVLSAQAASVLETPVSALVPSVLPPGVDPAEASMPRWRRPSLMAARKNDPLRNASPAMSLSFADGVVEAVAGKERRRIRYRLVRLMDVPDEVRANEIGLLDEGDEVQVIETSGIYRLVLCPDGSQGWLHKMVLGDLVDEDEDDQLERIAEGIDEDVLSAFIAQRQKTA